MTWSGLSVENDDVSRICDGTDVLLARVELSVENDDVTGLCDDSDVI